MSYLLFLPFLKQAVLRVRHVGSPLLKRTRNPQGIQDRSAAWDGRYQSTATRQKRKSPTCDGSASPSHWITSR